MKLIGKILLLAVVIYATAVTLRGNEPIILSSINLVFHEAGHPIFGLFGEVIGFLGGTLMQLLVPFMCAVSFYVRRDWFAVSFAMWWFGENMIGISKYISDARALSLPLLGGGTDGHDWNFLLGHFGLLPWDTTIGSGVLLLGVLIMSASIAGMGWGAMQNVKCKMQNKGRGD